MVQSGIAYAAGQLLAVVAPRTVLVVDAPTDWSLAGPLWELALDDAPVDEILDVLIRRGIRTAPSFAIVRVENDAVRALVRGSVPVCFERVGEPVRLDATGATTWLEGLISSARRVLVGAVETNSTLPYLVSTGVVLVSGLALPCGPTERDALTAGAPDAAGEPEDGSGGGAGYFARPAATPVASGGGSFTSAAGREPRVVDLTRSGGRTPAKAYAAPAPAPETRAPESRDSWALASARSGSDSNGRSPLNGHAPAVLDPTPISAPDSESTPVYEAPSRFAPIPSYESSGFQPQSRSDDGSVSALRSESGSRFDPVDLNSVSADDPGELQDLDPPAGSAATPFGALSNFHEPNGYAALDDDRHSADSGTADPLDDLLLEPDDDEHPRGPSPVDLPNLDPPSMSLPLPGLNGHGGLVPAQPRGFGGAPAAWPPAQDPSLDDAGSNGNRSGRQRDAFEGGFNRPSPAYSDDNHSVGEYAEEADPAQAGGTPPEFTWVDPNAEYDDQGQDDDQSQPDDAAASNFLPPVLRSEPEQPPALGELPLRIRGRSLRPEQRQPNGNRLLGGPIGEQPEASAPPFGLAGNGQSRDANGLNGRVTPAADDSPNGNGSGDLLLPSFFSGARAARKPGSADPAPGDDIEQDDDPAGPSSWNAGSAGPAAPAAWVPPVRRGFPDRSGFADGPPAMPGVLRSSSDADSHDDHDDQDDVDDSVEEMTEATAPPEHDSDDDGSADLQHDSLREPPRLLGVWCDAGHVTSPDNDECRVCGLAVPPQAPILVARPPLGVLIFDNGDRVMVDRPVVIGRDPKPTTSPDPEAPVLHAVPSATGQVSRTHAEIRASGWDVVLTDLGAMNGTALTLPGESPLAIESGIPTTISSGARIDLGGESGFVFEVEA